MSLEEAASLISVQGEVTPVLVLDVPSVHDVLDGVRNKRTVQVAVIGMPVFDKLTGPVCDGDGEQSFVVAGRVPIITLELERLRDATLQPDGSYSFVGTHHTSYSWERNYNAGWQEEHTYVDYRISVKDGRALYEVIDTRQRSSR